jgi:predicted MPP superfamily phosphohydrolase
MGRAMRAATATRRQVGAALLLVVCLLVACAAALRLVAATNWRDSALLAFACLLAAPLLLTLVVNVVAAPKPLARFSPDLYRALAHVMVVGQFLLPWLGWSALIALLGGREVTWAIALRGGGAVAAVSYLAGFALVLRLRPRGEAVEVTALEVAIAGLPRSFAGYRILHVSDLHGGARMVCASAAERLARASKLSPDMVVFTGDLAARPAAIGAMAGEMARLQAPDGRFAVVGNHDAWMGEERVIDALSSAGFRVLANEHVAVERGGERLYLVGVRDASFARSDDLPAALRGVPEGASVIVISHSPDIVLKPAAQRAALILAGHTHGGQVIFPWLGPLYVPTRLGRDRMAGLVEVNGRKVFITRGVGEVFPPFRLNCPPEIALITLRVQAPVAVVP